MQYAPRTIAFIAELIHPPVALDPSRIQKVHNDLFQTPDPAYTSFAVTPAGTVLSNPGARPGAVSQASFAVDRIQFREELGSLTVDEFAQRVQHIAGLVAELCGIQVFTSTQVTIRSLINPRNFKDAREFLKQGMFGFSRETEDFDREPELYGLRMVFPPREDQPNAHSLRIESFNDDPRSLFIENHSSFPPILLARGLDAIVENVEQSYGFLVQRALTFVGRFDERQEA